MSVERLREELAAADAELRAHMASCEYAFAMAGGPHGGREHPTHWATRARKDFDSGAAKKYVLDPHGLIKA